MIKGSNMKRGSVARRVTLAQREALLQRLRLEVESVVEDIQATAESLRGITDVTREPTSTERSTMRLIEDEQRRQQMELARLFGEYESLALRRAPTGDWTPAAA